MNWKPIAAVLLLAGCCNMQARGDAVPWCTPGAGEGKAVEFTVTIEVRGHKPTVSPDNCRVRPGTQLTWVPAGKFAGDFEGVNFPRGTPDVRGRARIPVDRTGSKPEAVLVTRYVGQPTAFEYLLLADGQAYDPVVIVDP